MLVLIFVDSIRELPVVCSLSGHHDYVWCPGLYVFEVVTLVQAAVN
jgi:hypothetical protein